MPEIQEMKVTVVKIVPEIQEEKKEEDAVDVPKESDDSVEIKQNEELSTLDRYEFKDEEEEIYLPAPWGFLFLFLLCLYFDFS
jgi:hypothetical protein